MMSLGMIQRRFLRQAQCSSRKAWHRNRLHILACRCWQTLLVEARERRLQKRSQNQRCWCCFGAPNFPHASHSAVYLASLIGLVVCIQSVFVILTMKNLVGVQDRGMDCLLENARKIFCDAAEVQGDQRVVVSLLRGVRGKDWSQNWNA